MFYLIFVIALRFPMVVREAGVPYEEVGGQSSLGLLLWSAGLAVALFVSIALHELGHAFVAQAQGIRVRGITLMMLGGVSQMERMPESRFSEFKLSIMGPLVSLALATVLLYVHSRGPSPEVSVFTYWLGTANLALAIFNLLPAFPLDGGRALRSLLASRQGMIRATQTSVKISKGFAWVLGAIAVVNLNVLLLLIAFFIHSAAQSELALLLSRGLLRGLKAKDITHGVAPISEDALLNEAANRMIDQRVGSLPVDSVAPKIVMIRQVQRVPRKFWHVTRVRDVMLETSKFLDADETLSDSLRDLVGTPGQVLPVRDGARIIGVARYEDLAEVLQLRSLSADQFPEEDDEQGRAA